MQPAAQTPTQPMPASPPREETNRPPPEVVTAHRHEVVCDGAGDVSPALGHPRVYLTIPAGEKFVDCTYCDRRFLLA